MICAASREGGSDSKEEGKLSRKAGFDARRLVLTALLTAMVVVLQMFGAFVRFGVFQIALVLVPIVVGAALYGAVTGAWLGFVFGIVVLLNGDATAFLQINALATVAVVLLKGAAAGLAAGAVYKLFERRSQQLAVLLAAIVTPIVNSGIFALGCYAFFAPELSEWAGGADKLTPYIFLTLIGLNFVFEFVTDIVLSNVIIRITRIGKKQFNAKNA
jgi:uncharacterized membrane protein